MAPRKTLFSGTTSSDDEDHTIQLSHPRAPGRRQVKLPPDRDAVFPPVIPKTKASGIPILDDPKGPAASGTNAPPSPQPVKIEEIPDEDELRAQAKETPQSLHRMAQRRCLLPSSTLEEIREKEEEAERIAAYGDDSGDPQVATVRADELQKFAIALEFSDSDSYESDDDI
ncbi:hypothetical protein AURDEDRAFT_163602 [Auricularia subglabra TFB-10046 SS5]|nr:hypothetical protein AURDEDRAFT_163602 [Auricularia subglabra TFB-10046 SS5]